MRHTIVSIRFASLALGIVAWGGSIATAQAQERPTFRQPLEAPSQAFELQLSTGYTQGFGNIIPNAAINQVAGAGWGFTTDLAYRFSPYASLDFEGQYQVFVAENSSTTQGLATNIGVTVHSNPAGRFDPWLRIASGWRWIWQNDVSNPFGNIVVNTSNSFTGWQIASLRLGLDIRSSDNVAWAPVIGADVQLFNWANGSSFAAQVGTFVYAGLQGRFDFVPSGTTLVAHAP